MQKRLDDLVANCIQYREMSNNYWTTGPTIPAMLIL